MPDGPSGANGPDAVQAAEKRRVRYQETILVFSRILIIKDAIVVVTKN